MSTDELVFVIKKLQDEDLRKRVEKGLLYSEVYKVDEAMAKMSKMG